ncbi:efflux RND transporter periplasmic adaptor subunit [Rhizobium bangladeshense]|uniref:efflux RND transporter periplasmic adaptor subunit n=1 Tax=Rhizobium bangladeshense TaxID=1138189 RepID=UPI001C83F834|nr:efflux RND transporter periplasmic adaptor subunit [Rhizobium bangladeshense]MBX4898720.1 efflux RND transporter periplasmic adaptor subunit [Rhizobium bangladeshense]MBY3616743.1 efflux RND transporter periplasmic adaptor subunit [Rhizobium bangladeshense]
MVQSACDVVSRLAALLALTALLAGCNDAAEGRQNSAARPRATVTVQSLHPETVTLTAELPGRTGAHLVSQVRPRVSGIVLTRTFVEGGQVKAGDVLYELDPEPFEASLRNAQAMLRRAESAVPSARARFERYRGLSENNAVSRQELDEAQSQMLQAEAEVAAATAAVETARIALAYTKVRAPIDGRIDSSNVTTGALVTENQEAPLTTIYQLNVMNVDLVRSSASNLLQARALADDGLQSGGVDVTVTLLLEDGTRYPHSGRLLFRNATVSPSTGTVSFRATFPNPDGLLMPGMYVRAVVTEGYVEKGFLLPQRAVSRNAQGAATAKFVTAAMTVEERVLPAAHPVGNSWLVTSGIEDGARLIIEGGQRVTAGQEVDVATVTVDPLTGAVSPASDGVADGPQANAGTRLAARDTAARQQ